MAESAAEVGLLFTTVVLITGPIWGKTIWGAWWTWDARLTLTLFLWFIYRWRTSCCAAPSRSAAVRARYSAVLGILGALLIPFIHLSVYLFRTLHPMPIVLKPSAPSLPPEMLHDAAVQLRGIHARCSCALAAGALSAGARRCATRRARGIAEGGR